MDRLRKERGLVRRSFTRVLKTFSNEFDKEGQNLSILEPLFAQVDQYAVKMNEMDEKIMEALLEDETTTEEELDAEAVKKDEYTLQYLTCRSNFEKIRQESEAARSMYSSAQVLGTKEGRKVRLPKIEPVKYDGELKGWLQFWGQFRKIDEDSTIDDDDKMQLLLIYTVPDSKARSIVEKFPLSGENYRKALNHLKSRCAKDECLVEVYVRELLQLIVKQATSPCSDISLSALYDSLETQLKALDTLGVTTDKYAAMLYPMVESCLPVEVLKAWGRRRSSLEREDGGDEQQTTDLAALMRFIKAEVENEERIQLAHGFSFGKEVKATKSKKSESGESVPTASTIVSIEGSSSKPKAPLCIFCEREHESRDCISAQKMTLGERRDIVYNKKACYVCLKLKHRATKCRATVRCVICGRKHYPIMCLEMGGKNKDGGKEREAKDRNLANHTSGKILLQTLLVKVHGRNCSRTARVLIDSGSQRSYILTELAEELNLKSIGYEALTHLVFGDVSSNKVRHSIYDVLVSDLCGKISINLKLLDQDKICSILPRISKSSSERVVRSLRAKNIELSDVGPDSPKIDMLLGADVIGSILTGRLEKSKDGLVLQETLLGWTVLGEYTGEEEVHSNICLASLTISDLWELETLGITDNSSANRGAAISATDTLANFERTIKRNQEERYEVELPWRPGYLDLSSNFQLAKQRLQSTTKRLFKLNLFTEYGNVFNEWLEEGIIEVVDNLNDGPGNHYLSHHAVVKESSATTKIRPVFDASAKGAGGISLNGYLEKGPNFVAMIPSLLVKFRQGQYGVTSDIRKAFLQISLIPRDRDFLRFLWWEDYTTGKFKVFRHCRVVFGVAPSPFLLAATLIHHLNNPPPTLNHTARTLRDSFYVDNCIASFDTEAELGTFISESKILMKEGKFDLRGWTSNSLKFTEGDSSTKVTSILGVMWNYEQDVMFCNVKIADLKETAITKRMLLSLVQTIFDPIGFVSPVTLQPKLILQEAWKDKKGWDDVLSENLVKRFRKWVNEVSWVSQCHIPRWVGIDKTAAFSVHVFCDASKWAYSTVIFLRIVNCRGVEVHLLMAKSRLAPIKEISIPRLELLATLIGARLAQTVLTALPPTENIFFWSDSMVALTWILKQDNWGPFINNRVKEIRKITGTERWRHVPGSANPADLPSRGCTGKVLLTTRWWEGPSWLRSEPEFWPKSPIIFDSREVDQEGEDTVCILTVEEDSVVDKLISRRSKYSFIVRVRAWVSRFVQSCRRSRVPSSDSSHSLIAFKHRNGKIGIRENSNLDVDPAEVRIGVIQALTFVETSKSERELIGHVQKELFKTKSRLLTLKHFKDELGMARVNTKLLEGDFEEGFKTPVLLPNDSILVRRLVEERHVQYGHPGVQTLLNILREDFWILKGRRLIRAVVTSCVICKKHQGKAASSPPIALPKDRVELVGTFQVTGIDLAGPLFLKNRQKVWLVLFTCAVYRAIHFELTYSLSTESFFMCLRRFIGRRGRPAKIYTDNGTNFTGAWNQLRNVDWSQITAFSDARNIEWKFIPPTAAWWGGWWERMVRTTKQLIRRNLGKATLTYEELETVLCDLEGLINARPLTYMGEDSEELTPLTPAHFLRDLRSAEVPDLDSIEQRLRPRFRRLQQIRETLRQRFKKDYLANLVQRGDDRRTLLKEGELVLVEMDGFKRIHWPLGRIQEIYAGRDNFSRVAKIRTSTGVYVRPIQRLYPLEVTVDEGASILETASSEVSEAGNNDFEQRQDPVVQEPKTSRSGRQIRIPHRFL